MGNDPNTLGKKYVFSDGIVYEYTPDGWVAADQVSPPDSPRVRLLHHAWMNDFEDGIYCTCGWYYEGVLDRRVLSPREFDKFFAETADWHFQDRHSGF